MYGCLLLLFGYLAWMYHSKAAAFLAIAGVFLYLLMKILLLIQEKRVDVRLSTDQPVFTKNEGIPVDIAVRNQGILPVCRAVIKEKHMKKQHFTEIDRGKSMTQTVKVWPKRCGYLVIERVKMRLEGFAGIAKTTRYVPQKFQVLVLPEYSVHPVVYEKPLFTFDDNGITEDESGAETPGEILGVREYRAGDSAKRIHWKATLRAGDYMVRDYMRLKAPKTAVIIDLKAADTGLSNLRERIGEDMLSAVFSIIHSLEAAGCPFWLIWYDADRLNLFRRQIASEKDLIGLYPLLVDLMLYGSGPDAADLYRRDYSMDQVKTLLSIDHHLKYRMDRYEEEFNPKTVIYCH